MKKFEKGKRLLAFLLVALMVVQQSSVTTLAEELAEYTQEAQNQDTEAVAEVSEASEPEASVPDSDKAQEQQPAAEEPAAPAEQETAEVTEAPQATEAPAQEAAPTEAPAQEDRGSAGECGSYGDTTGNRSSGCYRGSGRDSYKGSVQWRS